MICNTDITISGYINVVSTFSNTWLRHQMETLSALLAICAGNSPVTGEFPAQSQWHGALMFSLIRAWINGWINNVEAGDLRRHRAHYDVIVMISNPHSNDTSVWPFGLVVSTCSLKTNHPEFYKNKNFCDPTNSMNIALGHLICSLLCFVLIC